jgi:hypothetical protein
MPGQFAPEWGGQFDAESLVTFRRNRVVNISGISTTCTNYFCKEWNYAIDSGKTIIPIYKELVDQNMFLPCEPNTNIRQFILNKNNKLGIKLNIDNKISDEDLRNIKELQYKSKISDKQ